MPLLLFIFSICFNHNFPFLPPNLVPIRSIILADTHLPWGTCPLPPATCLPEQFPSGGLPLVHLVPWVICPQSHLLPLPPFQVFKTISASKVLIHSSTFQKLKSSALCLYPLFLNQMHNLKCCAYSNHFLFHEC